MLRRDALVQRGVHRHIHGPGLGRWLRIVAVCVDVSIDVFGTTSMDAKVVHIRVVDQILGLKEQLQVGLGAETFAAGRDQNNIPLAEDVGPLVHVLDPARRQTPILHDNSGFLVLAHNQKTLGSNRLVIYPMTSPLAVMRYFWESKGCCWLRKSNVKVKFKAKLTFSFRCSYLYPNWPCPATANPCAEVHICSSCCPKSHWIRQGCLCSPASEPQVQSLLEFQQEWVTLRHPLPLPEQGATAWASCSCARRARS